MNSLAAVLHASRFSKTFASRKLAAREANLSKDLVKPAILPGRQVAERPDSGGSDLSNGSDVKGGKFETDMESKRWQSKHRRAVRRAARKAKRNRSDRRLLLSIFRNAKKHVDQKNTRRNVSSLDDVADALDRSVFEDALRALWKAARNAVCGKDKIDWWSNVSDLTTDRSAPNRRLLDPLSVTKPIPGKPPLSSGRSTFVHGRCSISAASAGTGADQSRRQSRAMNRMANISQAKDNIDSIMHKLRTKLPDDQDMPGFRPVCDAAVRAMCELKQNVLTSRLGFTKADEYLEKARFHWIARQVEESDGESSGESELGESSSEEELDSEDSDATSNASETFAEGVGEEEKPLLENCQQSLTQLQKQYHDFLHGKQSDLKDFCVGQLMTGSIFHTGNKPSTENTFHRRSHKLEKRHAEKMLTCIEDVLIDVVLELLRPSDLEEHSTAKSILVFSPDGRTLASSVGHGEPVVNLWDTEDWSFRIALKGWEGTLRDLKFSPEGNMIATSSAGEIRLWDPMYGEEVAVLYGHSSIIRTLAFSCDGMVLASGSGDKNVRWWHVKSHMGMILHTGHQKGINSIVFSPDRVMMATGSEDACIRLWKVETWTSCCLLKGHNAGIATMVFSPASVALISSSLDGHVAVWNVKGGPGQFLDVHGSAIYTLDFSPDSKTLVGGCADCSVYFWEWPTGDRIASLCEHCAQPHAWQFIPGSEMIATGKQEIRFWNIEDVKKGKLSDIEVPPPMLSSEEGMVSVMALSPCGKWLAAKFASVEDAIDLLDVEKMTKVPSLKNEAEYGDDSDCGSSDIEDPWESESVSWTIRKPRKKFQTDFQSEDTMDNARIQTGRGLQGTGQEVPLTQAVGCQAFQSRSALFGGARSPGFPLEKVESKLDSAMQQLDALFRFKSPRNSRPASRAANSRRGSSQAFPSDHAASCGLQDDRRASKEMLSQLSSLIGKRLTSHGAPAVANNKSEASVCLRPNDQNCYADKPLLPLMQEGEFEEAERKTPGLLKPEYSVPHGVLNPIDTDIKLTAALNSFVIDFHSQPIGTLRDSSSAVVAEPSPLVNDDKLFTARRSMKEVLSLTQEIRPGEVGGLIEAVVLDRKRQRQWGENETAGSQRPRTSYSPPSRMQSKPPTSCEALIGEQECLKHGENSPRSTARSAFGRGSLRLPPATPRSTTNPAIVCAFGRRLDKTSVPALTPGISNQPKTTRCCRDNAGGTTRPSTVFNLLPRPGGRDVEQKDVQRKQNRDVGYKHMNRTWPEMSAKLPSLSSTGSSRGSCLYSSPFTSLVTVPSEGELLSTAAWRKHRQRQRR